MKIIKPNKTLNESTKTFGAKGKRPLKESVEDITTYREELQQYIDEQAGRHQYTVDESLGFNDKRLVIEINWGDWKHDHRYIDWLVEQFFEDKGLEVSCKTDIFEEDGSDCYSAYHYYKLWDKMDEPINLGLVNTKTNAGKWYSKMYPDDTVGIEQLSDFDIEDIMADKSLIDNCDTQVRERVLNKLKDYTPMMSEAKIFGAKSKKNLKESSLVDKKMSTLGKSGKKMYFTADQLKDAKNKYSDYDFEEVDADNTLPKGQKAYIAKKRTNESAVIFGAKGKKKLKESDSFDSQKYIGMKATFDTRDDFETEGIEDYDGEEVTITGCSVDNDSFRDSYWDVKMDDGTEFNAINGYNLSLNKSMNEASYGGAYDIEDDQFFTRDDLNEFSDYVVDKLNRMSPGQFRDGGAFIERGNVLELDIEGGEENWQETIAKRIDMRKIKKPSDLVTAYGDLFVEEAKRAFTENGGFSFTEGLTEDIDGEALPGPQEGPESGLATLINTAIQDEYKTIQLYNDLALTARAENFLDIADEIDEINTDENTHVGKLQELLKTLSPNANAIDNEVADGEQL